VASGHRFFFARLSLIRFGNQQSQVAQIVSSWTGHDRVAERREQRAGVEAGQRFLGPVSKVDGPAHRGDIGDSAGGARIAVNSIRTRTQHGQLRTFPLVGQFAQLQRAGQSKLLVAATRTRRPVDVYRYFAARDEATTLVFRPQLVETLH